MLLLIGKCINRNKLNWQATNIDLVFRVATYSVLCVLCTLCTLFASAIDESNQSANDMPIVWPVASSTATVKRDKIATGKCIETTRNTIVKGKKKIVCYFDVNI